jgi:hypothetical protein
MPEPPPAKGADRLPVGVFLPAHEAARRLVPRPAVHGIIVDVIHEVDESLRTLLRRDVVNGSDAEVVFDAPTREWSSKRSSPTVDLFLYDIQEDLGQRQQGLVRERGPDGRVVRERDPTRKLKLSYLATAWTQRPEDEHRLLSALLECLLRYDSIPTEVLAGSLADAGAIVALAVAVPTPDNRHTSDLWTAIGGELRPALELVATAPIQPGIVRPPAPPVLERTRLNILRPGGGAEARRARPRPPSPPSPEEDVPPPPSDEVLSAGQAEDDFDAPAPANGRPRGRTFRMRKLPHHP